MLKSRGRKVQTSKACGFGEAGLEFGYDIVFPVVADGEGGKAFPRTFFGNGFCKDVKGDLAGPTWVGEDRDTVGFEEVLFHPVVDDELETKFAKAMFSPGELFFVAVSLTVEHVLTVFINQERGFAEDRLVEGFESSSLVELFVQRFAFCAVGPFEFGAKVFASLGKDLCDYCAWDGI